MAEDMQVDGEGTTAPMARWGQASGRDWDPPAASQQRPHLDCCLPTVLVVGGGAASAGKQIISGSLG